MTFSLLARDEKTGALVAAAATGSLCVGGWVIRGAWDVGLVASQGTAPSTLWRDGALRLMGQGHSAEQAVAAVISEDTGRDHRQLAALDAAGACSGFTGAASIPEAGHLTWPGLVVAGNMLSGPDILGRMVEAWRSSDISDLAQRALTALRAAEAAGGDSRGLHSAALLVLRADAPPLDLRVDMSDEPLEALDRLLRATRTPPYADWLWEVPVVDDPTRAPGPSNRAAE